MLKPYIEFAKERRNKENILCFKSNNGMTAAIVDLYCINPDCKCVDVVLEFIEADENFKLKDKLFSIHLSTDTWQVSKTKTENKDVNCEELIDEFMNDLDEELKLLFKKRVAEAKAYGQENPWDWFDELELEDGSCFGYAEVFGDKDAEKFLFEYKGTNYFVDDQYCTNPECKCNEVILTFIEIIPGRKVQQPKFSLRMPFDRGNYQIEYSNSVSKDEIEQIFKCFLGHINNDFKLLRDRYLRMKDYGKKRIARKKQNRDVQRIKNSKIGRNDPCPCGSGKKFKKCCGK